MEISSNILGTRVELRGFGEPTNAWLLGDNVPTLIGYKLELLGPDSLTPQEDGIVYVVFKREGETKAGSPIYIKCGAATKDVFDKLTLEFE